MTWVLVVFSLLMLIWAITGSSASQDEGAIRDCMEGGLDRETCETFQDVGTGIGVTVIFILWFIGFLVLSLVWLMSRPRHRQCPRCGHDVKKGLTSCKNCGYDFAASQAMPESSTASSMDS